MMFHRSFAVATIISVASAHTIFTQLEAGGVLNPISYGIRDPSYDGPILDVTTNYVACNGGSNPTTPSANVITVTAGETVKATWRHTLSSTAANDAVYVIDPSHLGPVMAYMKKVGDATTDVGYGGGWFKISEEGYNPTTNTWAVQNLIANAGVQQITIPKCIANGQYLLRAELIALHAAGSPNGAQFYMECAQINVVGGTGASTPSTVSFPGAYSQTDPGILISIYYPKVTSYAIPGPRPFTCGAGSGPAPTSTSTSAAPTTATTLVTSVKPITSAPSSTKTTTSTSTTTSATTSASGAPLYGQCGGDAASGYKGPFTCAAGTCVLVSQYYSQCRP